MLSQQRFFLGLGKRVRELRQKHGYSQEGMSSFGFSARHWQQIEAGRPITVSTLLRICHAFNTSAERLVRGLYELPSAPARCSHEVQFYSGETVLLESFTSFIAAALKAGNSAIVMATKLHRSRLSQRLKAQGVDVYGAIQSGAYISLDAAALLSTIMVGDLPDHIKFSESLSRLVDTAAKAAKAKDPRTAICGECVGLLCAAGNTNAAIRLEKAGNELLKSHNVDILCAYPISGFHGDKGKHAFRSICAEHSAVHSR